MNRIDYLKAMNFSSPRNGLKHRAKRIPSGIIIPFHVCSPPPPFRTNLNWWRWRTWLVVRAYCHGKPQQHRAIPLYRQARLRQARTHLQGFFPIENSCTLQEIVTSHCIAAALLGFILSRVFSLPAMAKFSIPPPLVYFKSNYPKTITFCTSEYH